MAKHKTLQSVVDSFADSFVSLMNYAGNDYVMGHILTTARETGKTRLDVDLLSGRIHPEEFLRRPIAESIAFRSADFPRLVERNGSDPAFVASAHMMIEFDIERERPLAGSTRWLESPFVCKVSLTDDRGKIYEAARDGWWYPESGGVASQGARRGLISRVLRFFERPS